MPSFESYFSELNFNRLQGYATRWARQFEIFKSIKIYPILSSVGLDQFKYAIVFILPSDFRISGRQEAILNEINELYISGKMLDKLFINVYRTEPAFRFRDDWWITTILENEVLPEYLDIDSGFSLYENETSNVEEITDAVFDPSEQILPKVEKVLENSFVRNGEYWDVNFKGCSSCIQDRRRLHYIIYLLERPGQLIYNDQLVRLVNKTERPEQDQAYLNENVKVESVCLESESNLSKESVNVWQKSYAELLAELDEARESNCIDAVEDAKEKLEKFKSIIKENGLAILGDGLIIKSKFVRGNDEARRPVKNVRQNINNAKADFITDIPLLARHLDETIKIDFSTASYIQNEKIEWHVMW